MHKLPFVRPRFSPKEGEQYRVEHLQPMARSMFERVSQLTEIPVERLLPWKINNLDSIGKSYLATGIPGYFDKFHSVYRPGIFESGPYPVSRRVAEVLSWASCGFRDSSAQHEHMHALTNLLGRKRATGFSEGEFKAIEESLADFGIWAPSVVYDHPSEGDARKNVREVFRKWGPDALLGIMALRKLVRKPSDIRGVSELLERKGYLSESGFTSKGEIWFARATRKRILRNLEKINKARAEYDLPAG